MALTIKNQQIRDKAIADNQALMSKFTSSVKEMESTHNALQQSIVNCRNANTNALAAGEELPFAEADIAEMVATYDAMNAGLQTSVGSFCDLSALSNPNQSVLYALQDNGDGNFTLNIVE